MISIEKDSRRGKFYAVTATGWGARPWVQRPLRIEEAMLVVRHYYDLQHDPDKCPSCTGFNPNLHSTRKGKR